MKKHSIGNSKTLKCTCVVFNQVNVVFLSLDTFDQKKTCEYTRVSFLLFSDATCG